MNLLDIIIVAIMLFLAIRGIFRGFLREAASIAGVVIGIWLAVHYQSQMTDYLKSYLPSIMLLPLISLVIILVSVLLLCNFLGWFLKLSLRKAIPGWLDKTLGPGLALVKGLIIIYLVIILLTFFLPARTPLIAQSKFAPMVTVSYQSMIRLISPDFYRHWKKKIIGKKREIGEIVTDKARNNTK